MDSTKRPKVLNAHLYTTVVKGIKYAVIVGLFNDNPYEVFAFNIEDDIKDCAGKIVRVKKQHYNFESEIVTIENIQDKAMHNDEQVLTRLISGMLRHGARPVYVMEQIDKCNLEIVSYGKAISRILKKYIAEKELIARARCYSCNSTNLRMQEGCLVCNDCFSSKCG